MGLWSGYESGCDEDALFELTQYWGAALDGASDCSAVDEEESIASSAYQDDQDSADERCQDLPSLGNWVETLSADEQNEIRRIIQRMIDARDPPCR